MSTLTFDVPAPAAALDATITQFDVVDLDGNPNRVIEAGTGFNATITWELSGTLAPLIINDWHVRLYAESIGGGFEGQVAESTVATPTLVGGVVRYGATMNVPPAVTAGMVNGNGESVLEMVAVISHDNVFDARDALTGFAKGTIIEIRKP